MIIQNKKSAVLLGLAVVILVVALTSLTGFLEKETVLTRVNEGKLKFQLDSIRLAIQNYRDDTAWSTPGTASFTLLITRMKNSNVASGMAQLVSEGYVRESSLANPLFDLGASAWDYRQNLVFNSGFEIDDGENHFFNNGIVSWGNKFGDDLVPDGWKLGKNLAFQSISGLELGKYYILSFWIKATADTKDMCYLQLARGGGTPATWTLQNVGKEDSWRRYFTQLYTGAGAGNFIATLTVGHTSVVPGAYASYDGLQLEENPDPDNPFPSVWTDDGNIISGNSLATSVKQIIAGASGTPIYTSSGKIATATIKYGHF